MFEVVITIDGMTIFYILHIKTSFTITQKNFKHEKNFTISDCLLIWHVAVLCPARRADQS